MASDRGGERFLARHPVLRLTFSFHRLHDGLTQRWLGFADAEITIDGADGTFSARFLVPVPAPGGLPLTGFAGRWLARDNFLAATIAVPA